MRLIDDQQLAAIGAGGVLRDITATHGALHLILELMRFADPAEGARIPSATRGQPEAAALLDRGRVHVQGPRRDHRRRVHRLDPRPGRHGIDHARPHLRPHLPAEPVVDAQAHRLAGTTPRAGARLADGNTAYVGEQIITRTNDCRYRSCPLPPTGSRTVPLDRPCRRCRRPPRRGTPDTDRPRSPAAHVRSRVHRALLRHHRPRRSRRLRGHHARGRHRQRVPPAAVHDARPAGGTPTTYTCRSSATATRTPSSAPRTSCSRHRSTDLPQGILARDDSPVSASTMLAEQADPATRLTDAAARYVDAIHVAAEHHPRTSPHRSLSRRRCQPGRPTPPSPTTRHGPPCAPTSS